MSEQEQLLASIRISPIASLVTDFQSPDNPIIGVNDEFCKLTGYSVAEIIGRNCRFLGGPGTEAGPKSILREAVAEGRPALTELTNYKKDGTAFCNAVMIAPVRDSSGRVTHFLGSQMQVRGGERSDLARRQKSEAMVASLTRRQREVLALMAEGLRNREIAEEMQVTEATVKLHRSLLLKKLEANSPGDAVRMALEAGLR